MKSFRGLKRWRGSGRLALILACGALFVFGNVAPTWANDDAAAPSVGAASEADRAKERDVLRYGMVPGEIERLAAALELEPLRTLTVQNNGRRKPLDTFAREQVEALLGKPRYAKQDPLFTYLWMLLDPESFEHVEAVKIRNHKLLELLGMERRYPYVSFAALERHPKLQAAVADLHRMAPGTVLGPNQRALQELGDAVLVFRHLGASLRLLPPSGGAPTDAWLPVFATVPEHGHTDPSLSKLAQTAKSAFRARDVAATQRALTSLATAVRERQGNKAVPEWKAKAEVLTNRFHPLGWAWKVLALAAAFFGASALGYRRLYGLGMALLMLGLVLAAGGLSVRTLIVGRAPVANIYEAVSFATFAAVLVGSIFELVYRNVWFGAAAAIFGTLAFMLADLVPALDPRIGPIQAVLRSYWLNIHVTCMLFSYGTFAIALVLAIVYAAKWFPARGYPRWSIAVPLAIALLGGAVVFLPMLQGHARPQLVHYMIAMLLAPALAVGASWAWVRATGGGEPIRADDAKALRLLERNIYRVVQVGFLILTAGIILGAVWANESWGRYWGWDPKETWAFITWVIYGAFIHGYIAGWFRGVRTAVWQVLGFYAVLFTFFGVSYVLPGLHSYLKT